MAFGVRADPGFTGRLLIQGVGARVFFLYAGFCQNSNAKS